MTGKFTRKICEKPVAKHHHATPCDSWSLWKHIKCNEISTQTYKNFQNSTAKWYCLKCFANIIYFSKLSSQQLFETNQGKKVKFKAIAKPLPKHRLIDELNSAIDDIANDLAGSKYFEPNEISFLINKQISSLKLNTFPFEYIFSALLL